MSKWLFLLPILFTNNILLAGTPTGELPCAELYTKLNSTVSSVAPPAPSGRLVPPKPSVLSSETVDSVRSDRDRLRGIVQRDFKNIKESSEAPVKSNFVEALSLEAVQTANKMASKMKADLEKKGFIVELRTAKPVDALHDGEVYEIPEHQTLIIKSGSAKGPFARELRRLEKYIADRKKDPQLPPEVRNFDFEIKIDPLISVAKNTQGFFSASPTFGRGLTLSPASIFNGQDVTLEVMRHELRHMKVYFDLASGRPSVSRAVLVDFNSPLGENLGVYENVFGIDEIEGFKANLRNSQAKLGRETEAYRKQVLSEPNPKKLTKQYKKAIESVQREARSYADQIDRFIEISYENATLTRTMIADPNQTTAQFASRMSVAEGPYTPGVSEVTIDISKDGKGNGKKFVIQIPTSITAKGTEAIREHAMSYLVDLDTYLLERRREMLIRRNDINRDPLSRLPPSLRPTQQNPDSN